MKHFLIATIAAVFLTWLTIWYLSDQVAIEEKAARETAYLAQFKVMKPRAEKGEAKAQYIIARLYHEGKGVGKNLKAAARLYTKAADKGHASASARLGSMYEKGEGVKKDVFKAIEWYRLAAVLGGNADAQFALGQIYFHGRGVQADYAESFAWNLKAARQGHGAAQFLIGSMYQDGWSVKSDYPEAYMWYTLAIPNAEQAKAFDPIYDPVNARKKLMTRMNKFQISQGERKVKEYKGRR